MLRIIKQPFSKNFRLGDHLNAELARSTWTQFDAAIAFVKRSGVKFIYDGLHNFSKKGDVDIAVGVDLRGTSIEGLQLLLQAVNPRGQISVVHSPGPSTFHPKIYAFRNDVAAEVIIGSGNLTAGGLFTNFEGSLIASLDLTINDDRAFLDDLDNLLAQFSNFEAKFSWSKNVIFRGARGAFALVFIFILFPTIKEQFIYFQF